MLMVLLPTSRTTAKASMRRSSRVAPFAIFSLNSAVFARAARRLVFVSEARARLWQQHKVAAFSGLFRF